MGSDAEVYLFDYELYLDEIVPAMVALLRHGVMPSWPVKIRPNEWTHDEWPPAADRLREQPVDLAAHSTWIGPDLAYLGAGPVTSGGGRLRLACPDRCLLYEEADAINGLYEALVATRCLGDSHFVGRSLRPPKYGPLLDRLGVPPDDPLRSLLTALDVRGAVVGYRFETTSGIYGWLSPAETADLATRLDRLDLPTYAPAFAAMSDEFGAFHRGLRGEDWPAMSLSFVRTTATIAATSHQAILWGGDVGTELWRETLGLPDR